MASYYYVIASLPALRPGSEGAPSYGDFLEMCRPGVGEGVMRQLEKLTLAGTALPLLKRWHEYLTVFTREMNYQRDVRRGVKREPPDDRDPQVVSAVAKLLSVPDPLEAEKALIAAEFDAIDRMTGMHYFDEWALFGYALKLKLLERSNRFVHDEGKAEFQSLLKGIRQQINSDR